MPSTTFFDSSKEVAKKYINTVSYVDDLIYAKQEAHKEKADVENGKTGKTILPPTRETVAKNAVPDKKVKENDGEKKVEYTQIPNINPLQFTSSFINEGIHCSLIEIQESEGEGYFDNLRKVLRKSDVVILDWQMHNDGGEKATNLLASLISESVLNEPELKLYVIYTAETNYKEIIHNKIYPKLKDCVSIESAPEKDACMLCFGHTKIVVLNKSEKAVDEYEVNESHLPDRIVEEFAKMTSGLLSNFALHSLTTIRDNFHKILGLYSKELDAAYLGHKVLLPHKEDAEHLLCELLKDSIGDLLFYHNVIDFFTEDTIKLWLNENIKETDFPILKEDGTAYAPAVLAKCNKDTLNTLVMSDDVELKDRFSKAFDKELSGKKIKYLTTKSTSLFLDENLRFKEESCNIQFAKLTHHKNLFLPHTAIPILSLGTILHRIDENKKDDYEYYICIQQRCDSLRIDNGRKFLFLPLSKPETNKPFDTLTNDGIKLKTNITTHSVKTMKFNKTSDKGVVAGEKNTDGKFIFKSIHGEVFEWVLDLKDLHAQRIVTEYATQLSRVGLDESEWLRRNASI